MFIVGNRYSRKDIYAVLNVPVYRQKGNWATGYNYYDGAYYVFVNINEPGRTGHNYENHWEDNLLHWRGKTGSHVRQRSIRKMIDPSTKVHVFARHDNNDTSFEYIGLGRAHTVKETVPVTVLWEF